MRVLMICPELPSAANPNTMAPGARQIESIAQAGVHTDVVDMRGIPKLKYLQMIPRIRSYAKSVDLIHAHFGYCGWLALLGRSTLLRKVPIVISYMGSDLLGTPYNEQGDLELLSRCEVRCNQLMASRYDQVIVKSRELAEKIRNVRCHVIPNGVDTNRFRPLNRAAACAQLGLDPSRFNVLFPGNPNNPRKGYQLASAAVQAAQNTLGQEVNLVALHKIAPELAPVYMNACQAMLMTSVFEGSPNVVKEAMACNTPIIGVPVGDVHDLLDGVAGCYRTSRDANEIGQALASILSGSSTSTGREQLIARGLTQSAVAQKIIGIYRLALGDENSLVSPSEVPN